jgi:hypothetical protein
MKVINTMFERLTNLLEHKDEVCKQWILIQKIQKGHLNNIPFQVQSNLVKVYEEMFPKICVDMSQL